jgi:L-rhamnose isomerase / sugar isomerase
LLQSLDAILIAYAQALLVDRKALTAAQSNNDVTACQNILQDAFRTDVRGLVAQARLKAGAAIDPIGYYRNYAVRSNLIKERGVGGVATGL